MQSVPNCRMFDETHLQVVYDGESKEVTILTSYIGAEFIAAILGRESDTALDLRTSYKPRRIRSKHRAPHRLLAKSPCQYLGCDAPV